MNKNHGLFLLLISLLLHISVLSAQTPLWQRTNGPGGASISGITFDSSGAVYVNSNNAFRSTDDGATWEQLPAMPNDLHTLPDGNLVASLNNIVCISSDHGHTWQHILNAQGSIAVTPAGKIFVNNATNTFRSANNGTSWDTLSPAPISGRSYSFNTSTIFILGGSYRNGQTGLYRSTDDGEDWSKVVNGIDVNNDYGDCLAGTAGGIMFYLNRDGRYISSDDGRTWKVLSSNNDIGPMVAINNQGVIGVTASARIETYDLTGQQGTVFAGGFADPGAFEDLENRIIACSPSGEFWISGNPFIGKIDVSTQTSFTVIAPPTGSIQSLIADGIGSVLVNSGGTSGSGPFTQSQYYMYKTTDGGTTWGAIQEVNNMTFTPLVFDSAHAIIGGSYGAVARSTDGGMTWKQLGSGLTTTAITSLVVDAQGYIFMGCGEGVFRSTDGGDTWDQLNAGLKNKQVLSLTVNAASEVFAGTSKTLYHSTDHVMTWHALSFTPPDTSGITSLVVNTSGDLLAAIKNAGVFWSHDDGQTWSSIGSGLSGKVSSLLSTPIGHVFAGTDSGVFYLPTGGGTWVDASAGLGKQKVLSITRDQAGTVYLGTDGSGVYSSTQTYNIANPNGVAINASGAYVPMLYPNPSHGNITIDIPGMHNAKIQILDLLGRVIISATASEKWIWSSNAVAGTYIAHISGTDESGKTFQSYDRFVIEK